MPYVNCVNCNKEIYRQPNQLKNTQNSFCSRQCIDEWRKAHWVGKNSPAYKGKDPQELTCDQCGQKFFRRPSTAKSNRHIFCSQECKHNWQRENKVNQHLKKRLIVKCDQCGKETERIPAHVKEHVFCSSACFTKWKSDNWRGENSPFWKNATVTVICDICGKSFKRDKSEVAKREKHFCSRKCQSVWKSQQVGENSNKWNGGKVTVNCAVCGKELKRLRVEVEKRSKNFFCSKECMGQWRSLNVSGPSHPLWRGGWLPYYGPSWKYQRRNARKRDNFTCQHCGMTEAKSIEVFGQKLHVHHIKPFMEFGYIEGQNDNDKQANSLKNLITLCQSCHYKVEWKLRSSP